MSGTIYIVHGDTLTPMRTAEPPSEDRLQDLIARHSDLIGEEDGELLLVKREQGIADREDGSDRWSIDHLFVTRDALPVLVEVKRAVDTRLRREVVGQLLDYAANGALHWSAEKLASGFRDGFSDADEAVVALADFLGDEEKVQGFWEEVEGHLRSGEMKLLIVADRIPPDLARIVEFLNRQMRAEVYAIELSYYQGAGGVLTLVPRVIGRTEETKARASGKKAPLPPISIERWTEEHIAHQGVEAIRGTRWWIQHMTKRGVRVDVASTQGSLVACAKSEKGQNIYPSHLKRNGKVTFSLGWVGNRPGFERERDIDDFLRRATDIVGTLSSYKHNGMPAFHVGLLSDETIAYRIEPLFDEFFEKSAME